MTGSPAERLLAAADLLDKRANEASPGPWYYNGYSYVGSGPKSAPYNDWDFGDHTLEREGLCEECGQWREPIGCLPTWTWPRGHGCKLFDTDYDMDSEVVHVRSHHGDTAVRQRAADAEWIATMHPEVGKLLAATMREAATTISNNVGLRIPRGLPPIRVASASLVDLADLLLAGT